jgi:hypothetical protein
LRPERGRKRGRWWSAVRGAGVALTVAVARSAVTQAAWAGTAKAGIKGASRSNPTAGVTWRRYEGSALRCGAQTLQPADGTGRCWASSRSNRERCSRLLGCQLGHQRCGHRDRARHPAGRSGLAHAVRNVRAQPVGGCVEWGRAVECGWFRAVIQGARGRDRQGAGAGDPADRPAVRSADPKSTARDDRRLWHQGPVGRSRYDRLHRCRRVREAVSRAAGDAADQQTGSVTRGGSP